MNLARALRLRQLACVAFTGAGGKTTALFQLARELHPPVIVSATTHLGVWQIPLADEHILAKKTDDLLNLSPRGVLLVTGEIEGQRTKGPELSTISWLHEYCERYALPLLIEADGSRQRPLKAPGEHEPLIPDFVQVVVAMTGLTGLGKALDEETVHRPEIFGRLGGLRPGEPVTPAALVRVLTHPAGGLKNIPPGAQRIALLNQADTPELQAQADSLAKSLLPAYASVIIANLNAGKIHAVHEPIAGIVLAAGGSLRFGQPKQLLDWRGEPFVRAVAKTALEAGLSPVVVITGANAEKVGAAVLDLPVQIVHNEEWQSGQASSIRAALTPPSLSGRWAGGDGPGAAIFLLADQPQVTPTILHALMEEHAATLAPIIAPMVLDRRANPVLFDRVAFPDLMELKGDVGGRGIFSKHQVNYLPWHDEALLLDVDTPEHYQRIKDLLE